MPPARSSAPQLPHPLGEAGRRPQRTTARSLALAAALCLCALTAIPAVASAAAPTIPLTTLSHTTTTSSILEADLNPQGKATKYQFEYGPSDCSANPCTSTPEAQIPAGTTAVRVNAPIEGLAPGTTYHFRVVARHTNEENGETTSPDRTFTTFAPPQVFKPCPNDAFRTDLPSAHLPDCRAYEQASPVDKNGGDTISTAPFTRASVDGGAITFLGLSGIPGGLGSQEFPLFLANRDADGWSTQGLLPPATTGQIAAVLGWTPDFSAIYTKANVLGDPPILNFMAAAPGAQPTALAPYLQGLEPSFAGASEDGAEVLFESNVAIPGVSGAIEAASNLYLWDKQSGALGLAGVMNDAQAPPKGAFAGSYEWFNGTTPQTLSEGGGARRYYLQDQHAISRDGSTVFFTAAGSGLLYRRLNPTAQQSVLDPQGNCTEPAKACTISLSASVRTDPDPAGTRPAAFQVASADGTTALFTSSQMLTNDANTGPEQDPAAIERANVDGKVESIEPSFLPVHAGGVAVSGAYIYWADPNQSTIGRAKLDGSDRDDSFIDTGPGSPKYVAASSTYIYWTSDAVGETPTSYPATKEGTIGRAKLNGEGSATGVTPNLITGASAPQGIAVDSAHVYWANANVVRTINPGSGSSAIGRASLDGTEADQEFILTGTKEPPWGLAVDADHVYWTVTNPNAFLNRADLDGSSKIFRFLDGGSPEGSQAIQPRGIAVDANHVYWVSQGSHAIGRSDLDLTQPSVEEGFIPSAGGGLIGLATDASQLYWSSNGESPPNPGNDLYRYDTDAGAAGHLVDLAPDSADPAGTEIRGVLGASADAAYVYFAANGVPDGLVGSPNPLDDAAQPGDCAERLSGFNPSGECNLYLTHDGAVRFIARLDSGGNENETDATNWAPTGKTKIPDSGFQKTSRVSLDGKTLLFRSQRRLTDYDNEGASELYLYRADTSRLSCVSCNPTGEPPSTVGQPDLGSITTPAVIPTPPASTLSHNLSADGTRVFFETTDALVGADTNGATSCPRVGTQLQAFPACTDTYEWEAQGTGSCDAAHAVADGGCLYLISTGKGTEPQLIADASGDGSEVFFFSRSQLVGQDRDGQLDVYSARVDGGLASQNPAPPEICEGEGCKRTPPTPPAPESPATEQLGAPPQPPPLRCKKGFVKKHGRCVKKPNRKKQQDKKHRAHRHAKASR